MNYWNIWRRMAMIYLGFLGLGESLATSSYFTQEASNQHPSRALQTSKMTTTKYCGDTVEEAKLMGCQFDLMEYAWVTRECSDSELLERYTRQLERWTFYSDTNRTEVVPHGEVLEGAYTALYTNADFHHAHCLYVFEKLHRAMLSGRGTNPRMHKVAHTNHCAMSLLEYKQPLDVGRSFAGLNFLPCDIPV